MEEGGMEMNFCFISGGCEFCGAGRFALLVLALDLKTVSFLLFVVAVLMTNEKSSHQDRSLRAVDCHSVKIMG
jgi:hypothetical protein